MSDLIAQIIFFFNVFLLTGGHQGLPPGVPPQHYQQNVPQMQQVPMQHVPQVQQQHMHMQQVPMDQQQLHAQQQAQLQHQAHLQQQQMQQQQQMHPQQMQHQQQVHHGQPHAHGPPQVLNVANIAQEKQHIAEHLSVPIDTSKMTEQELQFHYFKMHDADNNNKLDGCELIKSLIHWHGEDSSSTVVHSDNDLETLVDEVLNDADKNNDGYVTYAEFKDLS